MLHLRAGVLSQDAGRLEYTGVLHDLGNPGKPIWMKFAMSVDDAMIDLVLECHQIVLRRRVAIVPLELNRIEESGSLVAQMRTVLSAGQGRSRVRISVGSLLLIEPKQLADIYRFHVLDRGRHHTPR